MRYLVVVAVLLLCGCAQTLPLENYLVLHDQQAFVSAFDSYADESSIEPLQQFVAGYPDSIWAERATVIIDVELRLSQSDEGLAQLQLSSQAQFTELVAENAAQKEALAVLTEQIEQLKSLLIDSEQHLK